MIGIIDCGSSFVEKIQTIVHKLGDTSTVIPLAELPNADLDSFSHVIISGAPVLITQVDTDAYVAQFAFLKTITIPVLGICNGHQVLGLTYGASISIGERVQKMERITILEEHPLFLGVKDRSLFREEHSENILVPDGFTLLASSASCDNEAMCHAEKPLYGVQFHPEVSGEQGKQLVKNFLRIV